MSGSSVCTTWSMTRTSFVLSGNLIFQLPVTIGNEHSGCHYSKWFFFHVLSPHSVCEIRLRPLMCWSGSMTSWIISWMQYGVTAKSSKTCKFHQPWVAVLVEKQRGARAGNLFFWWTCLSNPVPKLKKERNTCAQRVKSFSGHEQQGCSSHMGATPVGSVCMCSIDSHPKLHGQGTGDVDKSSSE